MKQLILKCAMIFVLASACNYVMAQYRQTSPRLDTKALNLKIETTQIVANGKYNKGDKSSFRSSLVLSYIARAQNSGSVFGKKWCPILRTSSVPSFMPLDWSIHPAEQKKGVTLAHCQDGGTAIDFTLVESASSPLNGRSMSDIIAGRIAKGEEFNFVLTGTEMKSFTGESAKGKNLDFKKISRNITKLSFNSDEVFGYVYFYQVAFRLNYATKILAFNDQNGLTYYPSFDDKGRMTKLQYKSKGSIDQSIESREDHQIVGNLFDFTYNEKDQNFSMASFDGEEALGTTSFFIENGNISEIQNMWKSTYKFSYDSDGRLSRWAFPDGSNESYFYAPKGNNTVNSNTVSAFIARNQCIYGAKYLFSDKDTFKTIVDMTCKGEKIATSETTVFTDPATGIEHSREVVLDKNGVRLAVDKPITELNPWQIK